MSSSRHPIALRLERQVGGATRLLATVMLLPLVDGIFAALVLAGALDTPAGIVQVGLLVFGGSATLAVIVAEMEPNVRSQASSVFLVAVPLVLVATLEAAIAPTIASALNIVIFERFAAVVIVAIAAKTASATIGDYLPRPSLIILLGLIASLEPAAATLTITPNVGLMARAAAAGVVGAAFALGVVLARPYIEDLVDIDRFRFGTAIALGTLAFAVIHLVPTSAPLPVFVVAGLLAFDPNTDEDEAAADEPAPSPTPSTASAPATSADGGDVEYDRETTEPEPPSPFRPTANREAEEREVEERAPWL